MKGAEFGELFNDSESQRKTPLRLSAVGRILRLLVRMKKIPLTQGYEAMVDDGDFAWINSFKWHLDRRCGRQDVFYAKRSIRNTREGCGRRHRAEWMHRKIIDAPDGMFVDHVNGNGLDNRRSNLRLCTNQQNCWNRQRIQVNKKGGCLYKGVSMDPDGRRRKLWRARIRWSGKYKSLGYFESQEEAALVYDVVAQILYGEFASLNGV